MDIFARIRLLKKEIDVLKEAKLTHNLKIFEAFDELLKIISIETKISDKRHGEIIQALLSLGAKIDNVSYTQIIREDSVRKTSFADDYKEDLMYIPDVEISGSTVRIKESNRVETDQSIEDGIRALEKALGG